MQAPRAGAFWVDSRLPLTASRSYRPRSLNGPRAGPWLLIRTPLALIRSLGRAGTPWQPGNAGLPATMRHQRTYHDGKPGFVPLDADGTHTLPDFLGNFFFNTLGISRSIRAPACCPSILKAAICFVSRRRPKSTGTAPSCRRCGEWMRPCRWGGVQQKGLRCRSLRANRLAPGHEALHLARRRFRP